MKFDPQVKLELETAKKMWPDAVQTVESEQLESLVRKYGFSVKTGDLQILNGRWYVTHTGLVGLANRKRCGGVHTETVREFCEPRLSRWTFKAVVYKSRTCKGFVGYGDADPSNVSPLVRGAELRIAETRAVNRALRKAYGIGICSIEEIGSTSPNGQSPRSKIPAQPANGNYGGPKLRDRLCQLIRQHQLDPNLVKAYATDFCGTRVLREASRDQIEKFVIHLADWAQKDRNALLCQLNSYLSSKGNAA
jgi:hypothetical protein